MKVALFKFAGDGHKNELRPNDEYWSQYSSDTRMSEWVEVEFPLLPASVTVPAELAKLAEAETELRNQFQQKLGQITAARANLLALTGQEAA